MSRVQLDLARLPFEVRRAADRADELLELVDPPGLAIEIVGDEVVVTPAAANREVCRVPLYRLREWDPELMRRVAIKRIALLADTGDVGRADRWAAAINHLGAQTVTAPADQDWCYLILDGEPAIAVHRSVVVPGWPPGDVTPSE